MRRVYKYISLSAAGIPDFRSPSTGIYDNLEEYNLPSPMAVFDISYFEVRSFDILDVFTSSEIQNRSSKLLGDFTGHMQRYVF